MPDNWKIFARRTLQLEARFIPSIKRVIQNYRAAFITDLQTSGHDTAMSGLQQRHVSDILPLLHQIYQAAGLMGARMTAQEIRRLATQKAAGFGQNEQWIRAVQDYLKLHALDLATDITGTMKDDIIRIMQKAVQEGWSIDETVKKLQDTGLITARAQVIARTEIVRAANVGHSIGAQSLPYEVDKKWNAADDHRTRHSHRITNQHKVGEHDTFAVPVFKGDSPTGQVDHMQFPGDPTASAANTVNCRCRVTYEPKRDANGRLVMREQNQARVIPMNRPQEQLPLEQIAAILKSQVHIGTD